ncbi:MAG TPA: FlgD immunoglobulin-like domain containing protein [Candidatus Krumholzibacteria bacterium]|nr:FlgD immunoglobulin-like domain containing protein [Candidatus Krumholzibacteria bacterium]HPD70394.1 FlgD immunoglobulin-like domain containing protein [Candidatus Krumholzibacteria bacterium]HRY39906.1 FlgD immunoglobulin-like domain containing protein [Candidatus Krumholzibacteria bacterium]
MAKICSVLLVLVLLAPAAAAVTHHVPGGYPTIQAGVNAAASGDTVAVAAGVYAEQVVIGVDLVLLGAGVAQTVVQAPVTLPYALGTDQYRGIICVDQAADDATVAELAVDGLGRNLPSGRLVGVLYYRAGGRIADLEIRNVHATPVAVTNSGLGVLATLDGQTTPTSLTVANVQIRRFQKAGLVVYGSGYTVDLEGVVVDPEIIYSDIVQNGIELTRVASVTASDCVVRNVTFDGLPRPEYTAVGFLANQCVSIHLRDISFLGCQTGCYLVRSPGLVERISVTSPNPAASPNYGLVSIGGIMLDEANNGPDAIRAPRPLFVPGQLNERPTIAFDVDLHDCTFDGAERPASRGLVVRAYTAEAQGFTAERCRLERWHEGLLSLEKGFGAVFGRFNGCLVDGNLSYGIRAMTSTPFDARGCRWGDPSGPFHAVTNPAGLADPVSDHVLYDPWLIGNLAPLPLPQAISLQDLEGSAYIDTLSVEYLGGATDQLYGYSIQVSWDPQVVALVDIERPARGLFSEAEFFQVLPDASDAIVDAAVGGNRAGIESGPLFTARFQAIGSPDWTPSPVALTVLQARNPQNQPVIGLAPDLGRVTVDLQRPVIAGVEIHNETLGYTDEFAKDGDQLSVTAGITDADPDFGRGGVRGIGAYLYGAVYLILPPDLYASGLATWTARGALLTPRDGFAPFFVEATDPSGNVTSPLVADTLIADNTRPAAVTGLVAVTGHNQVGLTWNDASASDLYYRQTMVRANVWPGYPFYDGPAPSYPASANAGTEVFAGQGTAVTPTYAADGSERGILYFGAMAMDMAGNTSLLGASSRARATNYRLGDVRSAPSGSPGDGVVDLYDITRLGDTYELVRSDPGFDGACDVAPADGGSTGVPIPDESIDFDDLMIFADQFDLDNPPPLPGDGASPVLRWEQVAPEAWALVLAAPCPELKGLRLEGDAGGAALHLEPGALLRAQPGPWFLHPGRGGCEAHLAVLGHGVGLRGSGELLRFVAASPIALATPAVELRDTANAPLAGNLPTGVVGPAELPAVFRVGPPTPNPFNPVTEIAFDLPAGQFVEIVIYGLDGRRVRPVLAAELPAGRHAARWDGRDGAGRAVAAGTYLYRVVAGPWSATGKLELIK